MPFVKIRQSKVNNSLYTDIVIFQKKANYFTDILFQNMLISINKPLTQKESISIYKIFSVTFMNFN